MEVLDSPCESHSLNRWGSVHCKSNEHIKGCVLQQVISNCMYPTCNNAIIPPSALQYIWRKIHEDQKTACWPWSMKADHLWRRGPPQGCVKVHGVSWSALDTPVCIFSPGRNVSLSRCWHTRCGHVALTIPNRFLPGVPQWQGFCVSPHGSQITHISSITRQVTDSWLEEIILRGFYRCAYLTLSREGNYLNVWFDNSSREDTGSL